MYKIICRHLIRQTKSIATTSNTTTTNPNHCRKVVSRAENNQNNYCLVSIDNKTNFLRRKMSSSTESPIQATAAEETASSSHTTATNKNIHTNRLITEKSPYLLQHAHNPVDWYPWGEEAIERARKENKIIFLSVGYSTCHWCHVMAHESFEDEKVAEIMNKHFINVKVDREERPDIDKIYMQFLVLTNGGGGWPMSVWLTPDLMPITSGTYFPPVQRYGMPAFRTALTTIAEKWQNNQAVIKENGIKIVDIIKSTMQNTTSNQEQSAENSVDVKLDEALFLYKNRYDSTYGGFGLQPKFPEIPRLSLLFHAYVINKDVEILDMALKTLQKISQGGIHDHLGGGFSRYAVDNIWHVPHFEKMLYDQAQLMSAYATAYKLTGDAKYLQPAEGIYHYIMRDLRHVAGGFYAGEDADSLPTSNDKIKIEGAFYAWTWDEIADVIKINAPRYAEILENKKIDDIIKIYAEHYDLKETGNVSAVHDPHKHFVGKNILIMRNTMEATCLKFQITLEQLQQIVKITNEILLQIRAKRPRPHLDTKILCSWNALMLTGLCDMAAIDTPASAKYLQTAKELLNFMREHFYVSEQEILLHACYGAPDKGAELNAGSRVEGFLDDYAFFINALINYYKLTLDFEVLQWARALQKTQHRLFWDENGGGYFYSKADANDLILRLKGDHDGAEPGGNSVAARNLIVLSNYFDEKSYAQHAEQIFHYYSDNASFGYALPQMMSALLLLEHGIDTVAVVGTDAGSVERFLKLLRNYYVPGLILYELKSFTKEGCKDDQERMSRLEQKFKMVDGKTTVYICHNRVCRLPITDTVILEGVLKENYFLNSN